MGWSFTYGATRRNIIEEVTRGWTHDDGTGSKTIKHCCRGNTLYAVHENTRCNGEVYRFIGVHLLQRSSDGWGYKSISEDMGPYQTNCPVSYIELAEEMPPSDGMGKNSIEWRAKVRKEARLRSRKYTVGQVVESVRPLRYSGGEVTRFKVMRLPKGGRTLWCYDADEKVDGILRLKKTQIAGVERNDRRAAVAATKEKAA